MITYDKVTDIFCAVDEFCQKFIPFVEEGLLNYKNNLIALNYPEADLYRNIKLSTIPRYLIYDKNGVLSYKNAPAPNSKQIDGIIESLLLAN